MKILVKQWFKNWITMPLQHNYQQGGKTSEFSQIPFQNF
ncbi:hypothetical protein pb186bvf_020960 [Paramecium bursaria]